MKHVIEATPEIISDYDETSQPEATPKIPDHGYLVEYVGYGTLYGRKVAAIYLFTAEEYDQVMDDTGGDEGALDWNRALARFETID